MTSAATAGPAGATCTQAEFAALLGVGKSYITALKQAGRLVFDASGRVEVEASRQRIKASARAPQRVADTITGPQFSDAKDRSEHYQAELQRLKYEREVRLVLETADVLAVVADAAATLRARLEAQPAVLAPQLAALGGDEAKIRALLVDHNQRLLATLAEHFGRMAGLTRADGADGPPDALGAAHD